MKRFLALFDFQGTIGPRGYLGIGVAAMAVKYLIDRQVAAWIAHQPWEPWSYLNPFRTTVELLSMGPAEQYFLFVMSIVAVPFVWLGLSLTVKRLRSMHSPLSYVVLFFIPFVNLVMFAVLSAYKPSQEPHEEAEGSVIGGAAFAVWTSLAVCTAAVALAAFYLEYGWALFVGSPFCLGLMSSVLYSWKSRGRRESAQE